MSKLPRHFLLMPVLGLVALAGAAVDLAYRPWPGDAAPYHKMVHDAAYAPEGVPETVGGWTWNTGYVASDQAANELLKPNVLIQRQYREAATGKQLFYLLDQCPDAGTMQGHYPPVCYVNMGQELMGRKAMTLRMKDKEGVETAIPAMEYIFTDKTRDSRSMVFNFFVMPSGRYAADIWEVENAAADFGRRYYGAAQVQFVFDLPRGAGNAELDDIRDENRRTVETFLTAMSELLKLIYSGGRS